MVSCEEYEFWRSNSSYFPQPPVLPLSFSFEYSLSALFSVSISFYFSSGEPSPSLLLPTTIFASLRESVLCQLDVPLVTHRPPPPPSSFLRHVQSSGRLLCTDHCTFLMSRPSRSFESGSPCLEPLRAHNILSPTHFFTQFLLSDTLTVTLSTAAFYRLSTLPFSVFLPFHVVSLCFANCAVARFEVCREFL
jgi:hypothetical protein